MRSACALIRLPSYRPELNSNELLNQDVKTNALGKSRPTSKVEMIRDVWRHLHRRQKEPYLIRNLFMKNMFNMPLDQIPTYLMYSSVTHRKHIWTSE